MKIKQIVPQGAKVHFTSDATTFHLNREETRDILNYDGDFDVPSPPEVVHLELTDSCNKNCTYCYVDKNQRKELSTEEWKSIIDDLAECPVFQITFGGGEAFLREDILGLAEYTRERMNLAVTTNGTVLPDDDRLALFDQINVSFHGDIEILREAVDHLSKRDIPTGINYLLDMRSLESASEIATLCVKEDLELLILTYKPVNGDWRNLIDPDTVRMIAEEMARCGVKVAVDMMTLRKCTGGDRFFTVGSNGDLFPCSFVRKPIGNLLVSPLKQIIEENRLHLACPYLVEESDEKIDYRLDTRIHGNCSEWEDGPPAKWEPKPKPQLIRRMDEVLEEKEFEDYMNDRR